LGLNIETLRVFVVSLPSCTVDTTTGLHWRIQAFGQKSSWCARKCLHLFKIP